MQGTCEAAAQVLTGIAGFHNIGIANEDAHLTEFGWRQAEALGRHIAATKPLLNVQVTTPHRACLIQYMAASLHRLCTAAHNLSICKIPDTCLCTAVNRAACITLTSRSCMPIHFSEQPVAQQCCCGMLKCCLLGIYMAAACTCVSE